MILEFLKPGRGISSQNIWGLTGLAEYLPPPPSTHGIYASQTKCLGSLTSHANTVGTTGCTDPGGRFLYRVAVVWVHDRQNIFLALLGAGRRPTRQPFRPSLGPRRDYGALDSLWFLEDI